MADTQEVKKQEAVAPSPDQTQAVAPQLSIADLQALLNIIDAASSRGAFRANELSNVGTVVDKLSKFLQFVGDQQKAEADASFQELIKNYPKSKQVKDAKKELGK